MAKQQIELGINSTFNGEGFKKLNAALKQSRGQIRNVSSGIARVADSLGGLDGAAGKTVGTIGKFAGSFAAGGIWGAAIQLGSMLVSKSIEKFAEWRNEAKKFADVMRTEVAAAFGDIEAKSKKMMSALEKSNRAISNGLTNANAAVSRDASVKISNLRTSTVAASDNAPESFRKELEAQERLEAATIRADAEVKKAENSAEALRKIAENSARAKADADAALVKAEREEEITRNRATVYLEKRQKIENAIANAMTGYDGVIRDQKVVFKETAKARLKLKELEEQYAGDVKLLKESSEKVASIRAIATAADEKSKDANEKLKSATEDLAAAQAKRAADLATANQTYKDFKKAEDKSWKDFLNAQSARLKSLEDEKRATKDRIEKRVAAAMKEDGADKKIAKIKEDGAKKIADIDAQIEAAKKEAARLEENAKRARGVGFGDWQRGERDREREERTTEGRKQRRIDRDLRELARLERMNPRAMGRGDMEKLAKLREWAVDQDPNNNPALKKQKELEEKKELMEKWMRDDISAIRRALTNGGLNI